MERTDPKRAIKAALLTILIMPHLLTGCGKSSEDTSGTAATPLPGKAAEAKGPSPALADVNQSLKSGAFDDAAARLLELQASGRNFTPREAADYRKAMNEAYTRALEAAEKGDARAAAAIQMIRAANQH
jgi:hypothetical protein